MISMKNRANFIFTVVVGWLIVGSLSLLLRDSQAEESSGSAPNFTPINEKTEVLSSEEASGEVKTQATTYETDYRAPIQGIQWEKERVLVLGDSLSVGFGPDLERELKTKRVGAFKNISVGGTMINQWAWSENFRFARTLDRELAEFMPTMVIVSLGTNDEAARGTVDHRGRPMPRPYGPNFSVARLKRASLGELSRKLSSVKTRVWICPPVTKRWPPDRQFRTDISNWGGYFFNSEKLVLSKQTDRLHITASGNRIWASAIADFLDGSRAP
jgi:lysophospholipase L1-like esterase